MGVKIYQRHGKDERLNVQVDGNGVHNLSFDEGVGLFLPDKITNILNGEKVKSENTTNATSYSKPVGNQIEQKETQNVVPRLAKEDFKVDSTNWKEIKVVVDGKKQKVKVNDIGDIWEYQEGEFEGKQKFTWNAAMRETQAVKKTMPDDNQWGLIMKSINPNIDLNKGWQNDTSIKEAIGAEISGCRNVVDGKFYNVGSDGYFWSSTGGHYVRFNETGVYPLSNGNPSSALSVRCLE
ncbi:hypothetical protein KAZ01_03630 [Candidatus Gracilibacteria bacterium]|nr:hypothetical protein [Candidatus Gracilibacteria bacterium]